MIFKKEQIALCKDFVQLLRPHQYTKNLFIFLPAFFSGQMLQAKILTKCSISFVAFCMAASAVYIFNDIRDLEEDRAHPKKKFRPLASGKVSEKHAYMVMMALLVLVGLISYPWKGLITPILIYLILNILYSYKLKHIAIVDVTIIAIGFVIRLTVGSIVTGISLTSWIEIMTFLLALLLGFAKRRDDLIICLNGSGRGRKSIDGYNLEFINVSMGAMSGVIIVAYIMYTLSPEIVLKFNSEKLYLTTIFIVLGILRYMQITYVENKSGSPSELLLSDRFLQVVLLCWMASFVFILYI